jgi:hypothetical protein
MLSGPDDFDGLTFDSTQTTDTTLPSTKIQCKNKIKPIIIKQEGLEKLLLKINPSKSSGPDNIPNRILVVYCY